MDFQTLDDFVGVFVQATQYEHLAKFSQGDLLMEAAEPDVLHRLGFTSQEALLRWAGEQVGRERRTMFKRLQVARVFAPDQRNDRVSWECHFLCTQTDDPYYWLQRAADMEMTTTQLKLAIKAAGGEPDKGETVFVCKAADAQIVMVSDDGRRLVLHMAGGVEVTQGTAVVVTMAIVQTTAPDDAAALAIDIMRGEIPRGEAVA